MASQHFIASVEEMNVARRLDQFACFSLVNGLSVEPEIGNPLVIAGERVIAAKSGLHKGQRDRLVSPLQSSILK